MKRFQAMSLCLLVFCGCPPRHRGAPPGAVKPVRTAPTTTMPATAPAGVLSPSAVMATVNGKPVYMENLYVLLLDAHGLQIAEILIVNSLVEQEAGRTKVTVTQKDIAAENDLALEGILGEQLTPDQRERVLERLLRRRGITHSLWSDIMRRNAILRKMVAPQAIVGESMIKAEFARLHGEKVQISHIQLPSLTEAEKIIKMLKEGKAFSDLALRYSTSSATAKDGGALPPFSRENPATPRAIRDAAFALKTGEISGIVQVGGNFHVLKLHKRFMPPAADYEAVKEKIRISLKRHLIERLQVEKLSQLRRKAKVEYVNPTLKRAANRPAEP